MNSITQHPPRTAIKFIERRRNPAPRMPDRMAFVCVALTTIFLAYGAIFGPAGILAFYGMWLPRLKYKQVYTVRMTKDVLAIMPFPILACLSFLWSKYPSNSLYASLEYTSSIICAIIIARLVRTEPMIRGVVVGVAVVLIASVVNGRYGVDAFSGNYSLVGLFGSKNMVGLFAEIGIIFSLFAMALPQSLISRCAWGGAPMLLCVYALHQSKSASSMLSLMIVISLLATLYVITRLPRIYRKFTFSIISVWFLVITVTGATLGWQDTILQSFGKSSTLTGRTTLWEKGIEAGREKPILGLGYHAFWVKGNLEAERLWYKFGIKARNGFHFHNTFIEAFAELGIAGLICIVMLFLTCCLKSLHLVLEYGMRIDYCLALSVCVMFLIRAFVELDLMGTFGFSTILFYMQLPRLATARLEQYASNSESPAASV